ncbi:GntR family transcriptional regulator [Inquilinus sp. CA228]|uniref:GntR family transcriptional regulator n=1 Tax=Inquilinus sp. CA228 TaxID=3455609 RepID=UPI003F8D8AB5
MDGGINNPGFIAFVDALIEGRLKLGQTLRQEELCDILKLSLSPLRESMTLLEAEGLVQIRKRLGVTIFYPDVKFVGSTFQFRELLEAEGLRRFTDVVTDEWIQSTTGGHREMIDYVRQVADHRIFAKPMRSLEQAFHDSFIAAFDNEQITANYQRLSQKMYLIYLVNLDSVNTSSTVKALQEHMDIIDALSRRDASGAVEALQRHMQGVIHRTLTH